MLNARFDKSVSGEGGGAPADDETPRKTPVTIARTPRLAFRSPLMQRPVTIPIQSSRLRGDPQSSPASTSSPAPGPSTSRAPAPKAVASTSFYSNSAAPKAVASTSFYSKPAAKTSPRKKLHVGSVTPGKDIEAWGGALHDPNAPGAVVMERPPIEEAERK